MPTPPSERPDGGLLLRLPTPLGDLEGALDPTGALVRLAFAEARGACAVRGDAGAEVARQVEAFFRGERRAFDLALAPRGTEFQRRVWAELLRVPFGGTISYATLAARLGRPDAVRAVARAVAANPLALVVPCHRVIGARGALTGYAWGIERKRALLHHEREVAARSEPPRRERGPSAPLME